MFPSPETCHPTHPPAKPGFASRTFARRRRFLSLLCVGTLLVILPAAARATTYNITTLADDALANGNCTLREALRAANFNAAVDACPAGGANDAIILPAGTYPFNGQESLSGGGSLAITSATVDPFSVTIDLLDAGRFVEITGGGPYVFIGLAMANGSAGPGGAVKASGANLTIVKFRFVSNFASSAGGAVYFDSGTAASHGLYLHDGIFLGNQAGTPIPVITSGFGGAAHVILQAGNLADIRDVLFLENAADGGYSGGGAVDAIMSGAATRFTCTRCDFEYNSAVALDGGAHGYGGALSIVALLDSTAIVRDSRFIGNSAGAGVGGMARNVIDAYATSGAAIELERLFIDANLGPGGSRDVSLNADSAASISLLNSELTFGTASGLETFLDSAGSIKLGHLTIADYPGTGMNVVGSNLGTVALQNSIVSFNGLANLVDSSGALLQTGNFIGGNPLFLDEPSGDYRLSAASPAIDSGTMPVSTLRFADLDHRSRVVGIAPDKGCFEFNSLFVDGFEVGDTGAWSSPMP